MQDKSANGCVSLDVEGVHCCHQAKLVTNWAHSMGP